MQRMTFYVCVFLNYIKLHIIYDYLVCQFDLKSQHVENMLNINSNGHQKKQEQKTF